MKSSIRSLYRYQVIFNKNLIFFTGMYKYRYIHFFDLHVLSMNFHSYLDEHYSFS